MTKCIFNKYYYIHYYHVGHYTIIYHCHNHSTVTDNTTVVYSYNKNNTSNHISASIFLTDDTNTALGFPKWLIYQPYAREKFFPRV